jgi:hypothetical protein
MRTNLKIDADDLFRRRLEEKREMSEAHARECLASAAKPDNGQLNDKVAPTKKIIIGKPAFHPKF